MNIKLLPVFINDEPCGPAAAPAPSRINFNNGYQYMHWTRYISKEFVYYLGIRSFSDIRFDIKDFHRHTIPFVELDIKFKKLINIHISRDTIYLSDDSKSNINEIKDFIRDRIIDFLDENHNDYSLLNQHSLRYYISEKKKPKWFFNVRNSKKIILKKIQSPFVINYGYSPYDNITAKSYPNILATAGLHDSQVQYWEPAKWVAKMRELKTDDNPLLLHTNMEAGHSGASGRFKRYEETAMIYAFLLDLAGSIDN